MKKIDKYVPFYEPRYTQDDPKYEYTEVEAVRTYVDNEDDVVIIGGGFGVTAVVASKQTSGEVTVFEQTPSTYEILKRTIKINGRGDNIKLRLNAVGKVSNSTFTDEHPSNVEVISPKELPPSDVYEIDCEGAETIILREMTERPLTILVETHNNHEEVIEILNQNGYNVVESIKDGEGQHPKCTHVRAKIETNN